MTDTQAYEATSDSPRIFIAYGGTVSDALIGLADLLRLKGLADVEPVAITYANYEGDHTVTAVLTS